MKKDNSIQIARAIALIMVLIHHSLSHIEQTKTVIHVIFSLNHVHVVVFFVIAGLLFETQKDKVYRTNLKKYFCSKWNRLMVPYLFWFVLISAALNILLWVPGVKNILFNMGYVQWSIGHFVWNVITMQDYYVMHLWFLYVLFLIYIVNYIAKDFLSEWKIFCVLFCGTMLLKQVCELPMIIDRFCIYYVYVFFGRMLVRYKKKNLYLNYKISIIAILLISVLAYMECTIPNSFSFTYIGNFIWGLSGTQIILVISILIFRKTKHIADCLSKIGDFSYSIYLVHNPYIVVPFFLIMRKIGDVVPVVIQLMLSIGLCVTIPICMEQVVKKTSRLHKIMFGG